MKLYSFKYKNITILALIFIFSVLISKSQLLHDLIFDFNYFAAFIAGAIFISTYTAPLGALILLILAQKFPIFIIWIIASTGAIIFDLLLFKYLKDGIAEELEPVYESIEKKHFRIPRNFNWILPFLGGIMVLTPLPHDLGTSLMGIQKLKKLQLIKLSLLINVLGILFVLFLSFFIKP